MKRVLLILVSLIGVTSALGQSPIVVDELVAIVGDQPIMLSDVERMKLQVIEQRKSQGVTTDLSAEDQALELLLMGKFMCSWARRDSLDKNLSKSMVSDLVEKNVEMMVESAGGVKALERRYGKAIFQIKRDVEREMLDNELARMMESQVKDEIAVNYSDVSAFFAKLPLDSLPEMPPQYRFSQIVKMPEQTEERKFKIREQLLEFRQRVLNGEKLAVLARLYSQDIGTKNRGGEMTFKLGAMVAPFEQGLEVLSPGQISEIVETEYGMHLIELISRKGDMIHCRHLLLKPEFTVEEEAKVINELDSLTTKINSGDLTFEEAALKHSNHRESAQNGGRVMNLAMYNQTGDISNVGSSFPMDELNPNDYRYLNPLKEGEISRPFENMDELGNRVFKIVRLDKKMPSHPASMETDYDILLQITRQDKQNREVDKWIDKNIPNIYVYISPRYRNVNFVRPQWMESCLKYENAGVNQKVPEITDDIVNEARRRLGR